MKILFVCYEHLGGFSASNRQVLDMVRHMHELGHEVILQTAGLGKTSVHFPFVIDYIPLINIHVLRFPSYLLLSVFYLLRRFIFFRPDVVFFFEILMNPLPLALSRLFRRPFVTYINGIACEEMKLKGTSNAMIWLVEKMQKLYTVYADKVFAITDTVIDHLISCHGLGKEKTSILSSAVDTGQFRPVDKSACRMETGLPPETPVVGFCGSFLPWQGLDYLLFAAPFVIKEIPDVTFVLLGQGMMKREWEQQAHRLMIRDAVRFLDPVAINEVHKYINAFDVCVVFFKPLRENTGDPTKLYEYLACGRAVVTNRYPKYGGLVEAYNAGISVDAEKPEKLAEALITLLKDAGLRDSLAKNGREAVVKSFSWKRRAAEIEEHLMRMTGPKEKHGVKAAEARREEFYEKISKAREDFAQRVEESLSVEEERFYHIEFKDMKKKYLAEVLRTMDSPRRYRVADLGCGQAQDLAYIAGRRNVECFGLDLSLNQLLRGRRNDYHDSAFRAAQGDMARVPFKDGSFDYVLSSESIEHLPQQDASVRHIYRILRPGGIAALTTPNRYSYFNLFSMSCPRPVRKVVGRFLRGKPQDIDTSLYEEQQGVEHHEHVFSPGELRRMMESAGFTVTVIRGGMLAVPFPGLFNKLRFLYSVWLRIDSAVEKLPWSWFFKSNFIILAKKESRE